MKKIKNYDEIILESNTLIILDIDDTIIKFNSIGKTWWKDMLLYYERNNDKITASNLAYDDWKSIIENENPEILDRLLFSELLNQIDILNCKLLLLTARDSDMNELTLQQLNGCGVYINPCDIYYSSSKGKKVKELYDIYQNHKIIFVDDILDNVIDVEITMKEYNIDCYLLEHENI
jgi:hypothetical protein